MYRVEVRQLLNNQGQTIGFDKTIAFCDNEGFYQEILDEDRIHTDINQHEDELIHDFHDDKIIYSIALSNEDGAWEEYGNYNLETLI